MTNNEVGPDKPLAVLGDYTKWLTGLATGGLAFSIGLQQNFASYHADTRDFVVASWVLYAVSVLSGVFLQSAFPTLYEDRSYSIRNGWLYAVYYLSFGTLVLGSFTIFLALSSLAHTLAAPEKLTVKTASQAVASARNRLNGLTAASIDSIELLKGADASDVGEEVWHVRFMLGKSAKDAPDSKLDVLVDAATGATSIVAPPTTTTTSCSVKEQSAERPRSKPQRQRCRPWPTR